MRNLKFFFFDLTLSVKTISPATTFIWFILGLRELRRHEVEGGAAPWHLCLRVREAQCYSAESYRSLHQGIYIS